MWLDHRTNMMATERYSIQLTQGSRALRGLGLSGNSLLGGYTNPTPPHLDFTITITRPMPAFGLRRESFPTCQNKFSIIFMKVQTPQKRPDPKHPHTQTLPLLSFVQTTRSSSSSVQTTNYANYSHAGKHKMLSKLATQSFIILRLIARNPNFVQPKVPYFNVS